MTPPLVSHNRDIEPGNTAFDSPSGAGGAQLLEAQHAHHRSFRTANSSITLDEFLAAPQRDVRRVAPQAIVYAPSGTRRQAALAGIDSSSDAYAAWSRSQAMSSVQLLFDHGVRHVFTLLAGPGQFQEVGNYRERMLEWIEWATASREALAEFRQNGWRVRLLCDDGVPQLERAQRVLASTQGAVTVWFQVISDREAPWRWMIDAIRRCHPHNRAELITAIYGEQVPLVELFIAFGKPTMAPELLPPLLADNVQCYWTQRPGYSLTETELRHILYDYAFLRQTWQADKTGRAEGALEHAAIWENGSILGLGQRLGAFWYPLPFDAPRPADVHTRTIACAQQPWQEQPAWTAPQ